MRRLARCVPVFALLLFALPAAADDSWRNTKGFKTLMRTEAKQLKTLMRAAVKADNRRQAYYLADRLMAADPEDEEAVEVLEQWTPDDLQQGQPPKKSWLKKRDQTLKNLGNAWFHFGETLEASGMDPVKYYPVNVRAHAYGSEAGNLLTALRQAGYMWCGTFLDREISRVSELLGPYHAQTTFPPEFDDDFLKVRVRWPEAKVARWGGWRLNTDHDYEEAFRLLRMLAELETWVVKQMGSKAKKKDQEPYDMLVFRELEAYDKIGAEFVPEDDLEAFRKSTGWVNRWRRRVLVAWKDRDNAWVGGGDDLMLGHAARVLARRHLSGSAGGMVQGRGAWILLGLEGAFEGFRLDEDQKGWIDPGSCWRVAVAAALRDADKLLPWDELMEMTWEQARDHPRIEKLKVTINGTERTVKNVDVVKAQATALVVGLLKADKKSVKKTGKLFGDLYKRDSLPDIDKAMGWKSGRAIEEAGRAMDAAGAK